MLPIFSKPIEDITAADVQELVDREWPEGETVEFKEKLPVKKGMKDLWVEKHQIGDHARNEILAEVVAFANAHGGMVILGIEETSKTPPRAASIHPIPRCTDLADRLLNMARDCIEPMIPIINVRGVVTDGKDGGVIVIRVPQSRLAPHRLKPTRECYYRRADRSEKMTMRDIQDLTLRLRRGIEAIQKRFDERRGPPLGIWIGAKLRATALPTSADVQVGSVSELTQFPLQVRRFTGTLGRETLHFDLDQAPFHSRPILRGVRNHANAGDCHIYEEMHCDGLIETILHQSLSSGEDARISLTDIVAVAANTVASVDRFRTQLGAPDIEFGLEIELIKSSSGGDLRLVNFENRVQAGRRSTIGQPLPNPLLLPQYSIGGRDEFERLISQIYNDVLNAAGLPDSREKLVVTFPPRS